MQKSKVTIVVPPVTCPYLDPHSGFPFLPHMAAYLASSLLKKNFDIKIYDMFSNNFNNIYKKKNLYFFGDEISELSKNIDKNSDLVLLYARTVTDYEIILQITKYIKSNLNLKVCVFENSQNVEALSLIDTYEEILSFGADLIIFGEPENRCSDIAYLIEKKFNSSKEIDYAVYKNSNSKIIKNFIPKFSKSLDELPFPSWENWNLKGYWQTGYAHPPIKKGQKFISLITSRGCPFKCNFCVAPKINPEWRGRSARNIVDEMQYFNKNLGIDDFHIEDLNPTIKIQRFIDLSKEIISKKLKITWKFAQGTKIETIKNKETFELFYKAGCRFFSFSPESGSEKVTKDLINKKFNYSKALDYVKFMHKIKLRSQACFVIGMPGENFIDYLKSFSYMMKLTYNGIDEVACYIITPTPGSKIYNKISGFNNLSELSHTPNWRKDILYLKFLRYLFYFSFVFFKMLFHPFEFIKVFIRLKKKQFETKMEMSIYKYYKFLKLNKK